ncbi:MAG: hypothetical protein JSV44_01620, partial [Candidatus Zixiibacteriota bacterium]
VDDEVQEQDRLLIRMDHPGKMGMPGLVAVVCRRICKINKDIFAGVEFITKEHLSDFFSKSERRRLPSQVAQFTGRVQNKVVRFVFDEQVKERQRGLL